ncbi:response regulator [Hyalangium versicolor]|uniref:response regulator n=1 Tax=Hyalangium versicolor TaxID=2861190 RepID=UPI00272D8F6A|nr:response regulator [Hyalangium versicolor]
MSGGTVLFLEKERELQAVMPVYLRERGYRVETGRSVAEAQAVLARMPVSVVVVDSQLPGMVDLDFLRELRRGGPSTPILLSSRFWKDVKGRESLLKELGIARILQKPYTPEELFIWVEQALAARPRAFVPPPKPVIPPELAAELAAATADYARHMKRRLASLTESVAKARAGSAEAVEAVYYDSHKMHGSAGSFGFLAVGEAAGRLEAKVRPAREGVPVDWESIEAALGELAECIAEAIAPPGSTEGAGAQRGNSPVAPMPASAEGVVLVVDDDPVWLNEVAKMAEDQEVEVVLAHGLEEALERVREQWLDGALLHVHLGGPQGGFEAAARLRSEGSSQGLPLAFFGHEGDFAHRVAAAHAGGSLYLPKPFTAADLTGAVERLVTARRPERARVLVLVDDEATWRALRQAVVGLHVELVWMEDPFRLLDALAEHRPDLLLLDVDVPGPSGFDLCRLVRSTPAWQQLPVLLLTAQLGQEFRATAFESGADDYVTKPVLREELIARVLSRLERARLARERSERDALTGLLLRRPLLEALRARLAESQRQQRPLAVCFLDVDHFKRVNDTHGHLAGDQVLSRLGRLLATRFRREDLRGRWGGEEFLVVLTGETAASAREILSRTAAELAQIPFESERGEPFHVTFSAGIAEAPKDGGDAETLLRVVDARLYRAKDNGRNRIEIEGG